MPHHRLTPRQNRAKSNGQDIADAKARGDWRAVYIIASQWVMAEAKALGEIDPAKESEVYEALSTPLLNAAGQLNNQTWRIHA